MPEIKWRTGEPPRNGNYIVETDDGICMDYWFIYTWDDYGDKVKGWMPIEGDIEEVVRCKDCKHWHESVCFKGEQGQTLGQCDCTMSWRDTEFFCKAGEKERS